MGKIPSIYIGTNMEAFFDREAIEATHKAIAMLEPCFHPSGQKAGLEIWRVNNFRLEVIEEVVNPVFFRGDCYLLLRTYDPKDKGSMEVFFWIGSECTGDERTTVAYKATELDDFHDTKPSQFRILDGREPSKFLQLFKSFTTIEGGVESGFRTVVDKVNPPRLLHVKGRIPVIITQVPLKASSLNSGDVFVLDTGGTSLYQWNGRRSNAWERRRAMEAIQSIVAGRVTCKHRVLPEGYELEEFWAALEGGPEDVLPDIDLKDEDVGKQAIANVDLFRLSDETGELILTQDFDSDDGKPSRGHLDPLDVFLIDPVGGWMLYVWLGLETTVAERKGAMLVGSKYLEERGTDKCVSIVTQSKEPSAFWELFSDRRAELASIPRAVIPAPVEEPVEEPVVVKEPVEEPIEEPIEEPVEEPVIIEEPIEEPIVIEEPVEEPIEEPVEEPVVVEEPVEEPVVVEEPVEEPVVE